MARLVGRDPASLAGVDVGAIVAPNEQAFAASIVDLVRAGSVRDRDTVFVTAQGEPVKARYVRLYSKGNTSNDMNHYVEVEVLGLPAK